MMDGKDLAWIKQFLRQVEEGEIRLNPIIDPQDIYAGDVIYATDVGWEITIFNDCNDWDYIDSIRLPSGKRYDFDSLLPLRIYKPGETVAWERYGIPGYLTFRKKNEERGLLG